MKDYVLDENDFKNKIPFFNTRIGKRLIKPAISLMALDKVNATYKNCCHERGYKFSTLVLDDIGVKYKVNNEEKLKEFPEGAFITVSNHPYGAIDGIALISLMGTIKPEYKVMVNSILGYIEAMSPNFITVEPYNSSKGSKTNLNGIKNTLKHIKEGNPMGFFPAGGVSKLQKNLKIEDQQWADNIIRIIKQSKVPVIPIYFHGYNSRFFYLLGVISWKLRSLRLAPEVYKSRGRTLNISIGDIISVDEIEKFDNLKELGKFLRDKTYLTGQKYS